MKEKIKKKHPKGMPRWKWREQLGEEDSDQLIEWFEKFFIEKINKGLSIKSGKELENILGDKEELTKEDKKLLLSSIPSDELAAAEKMNNLFKDIKKDAKEWNDEIVDALNEAFDDEAKNWSENKKFGREIGFEIDPPKVSWNENFKELYKKSNKLLSGIVQNWYFKHGKGRLYRWRI